MSRRSAPIPPDILSGTGDSNQIKKSVLQDRKDRLAIVFEKQAIEKWGRKIVDTCKEYIANERNKKNRPYYQMLKYDETYITDKSNKIEDIRRTPLFYNKHAPDLVYQNYVILMFAPFFLPLKLYNLPVKFPKEAVMRLQGSSRYEPYSKYKPKYWWENFDPVDLFSKQYNCSYDLIKTWLEANKITHINASALTFVTRSMPLYEFRPGDKVFAYFSTFNDPDDNTTTDVFSLRNSQAVPDRIVVDEKLFEKYQIKLYFGSYLHKSNIPPPEYEIPPITVEFDHHVGVTFPNIRGQSFMGDSSYSEVLDEDVLMLGFYREPYAKVKGDDESIQGSARERRPIIVGPTGLIYRSLF